MNAKQSKSNYIRRMARILFAIEYLGRYCNICGLDGFENPSVMDFHHRDHANKKYEVKNYLYAGSFQAHKLEIDKCVLICANCHRKNHADGERYKTLKNEILSKLSDIKQNESGKLRKIKNVALTLEQKNIISSMLAEGFIMAEIARVTNINYDVVKSFVRKNKLGGSRRTMINMHGSSICKLLNAKYSIRGVADKLGLNRERVRNFVINHVVCEEIVQGVKRYHIR